MSKADQLVETIRAVHAAGLDEALWPQALTGIARLCGGAGTTLEVFDKVTQRHLAFHAVGVPSNLEANYLAYWAPRSPRVIHGQHLTPGTVAWDYQILDEPAMDRDGFYSELLPITDFRYFISGTLMNSATQYAVVAVQRTRRQGHVGDAEIDIMRTLVPHLQQTLDVATRLKGTARTLDALEQAFDWLSDGAALLGCDGCIVFCNTIFEQIAARGDGMQITGGAIEFSAPAARARFESAFASLIRSGDTAEPVMADFAAARSSDAPAYMVSLRPIDRRYPAPPHGAMAIVFIRDPLARNAAAIQLLREMFGLTPAEASLAHALQSGVSPIQYARDNALSPNTVYTHLRRIKEKTGWTRIAELNRKLNQLRVPLHRD